MTKTIAILGALDTKGLEFSFLKTEIHKRNCKTLTIDTGVLGDPLFRPDITHDLVAEAGGTTLAELAAMRVPPILIPFPAATDDHQFHNAAALSRTGAALLLNQKATSPQVFARETLKLATNPVRRADMATALGRWHSPDAAARIAARVVAFASLNHPEARVLNPELPSSERAAAGLRAASDPETPPTHETPRAEHGVARSG